jgi:lipoate---protein ligase
MSLLVSAFRERPYLEGGSVTIRENQDVHVSITRDRFVSEARSFSALTLTTLAENLALDELLLTSAEEGLSGEFLRIWEWRQYAVVLGAGCRLAVDVDVDQCKNDGVPIFRRTSGGGTVLLGPGCLCFSLLLNIEAEPALGSIRSSYSWILARVCDALRGIDARIHPAGISDLAIGDRKCSGSAQQRKRKFLLHHASLLYDFDLVLIGQYLHMPSRRPEYRQERTHAQFLTNLAASVTDISTRLRDAWQATNTAVELPLERASILAQDKYLAEKWTQRR